MLSPSGAFYEGDLYALNVRPGWLRLEQYDESGVLSRILVEPTPAFGKEFYPTDVTLTSPDVVAGFMEVPDGLSAVVAVSVTAPQPEVRLYGVPAPVTQR